MKSPIAGSLRALQDRLGIRLGRLAQWLLIFGSIAYGVIGALKGAGAPSPTFWTANAVVMGWVLLAIAQLLQYGGALRVKTLEDRRDADRLRIEAAEVALSRERERAALQDNFVAVLLAIAARADLPPSSLGISAWRVSDDGSRLDRVAYRRFHSRARSGVRWTKGKGVIGRCWQEGAELLLDLSRFRGMTKDQFMALDLETRVGLEWPEYLQTRAYSAVFATPVRDAGDEFVGAVSVDCDHTMAAAGLRRAFNDKAVLGVIENIRNSVANLAV